MPAFQTISKLSIDQLESNLISLSQRVNAAVYDFLVPLREFDLRQGWKEYQYNSCVNGSRCCG